MNFKRYFISIAMIVCVFSVSSFAAQKLKAVAISGGESHSLILADNNEVFAAGLGEYGQIGIEPPYSPPTFVRVEKGEMNTSSLYLQNITGIAAGWTHSLMLDANHCVWATGGVDTINGYLGQLGNGDTVGSLTPVQVHAGEQNPAHPSYPLRYITKISAGRSGEHSLAVDANNFCYAWGRNIEAQLGNNQHPGTEDHSIVPVKVLAGQQNPSHPTDSNYPLSNIIAVSAGEAHSMALEKLDSNYPNTCKGRVYTFGSNDCGDLGIDTAGGISTTPVIVKDVGGSGELQNIVAISAGSYYCMALEKYVPGDPNYKGRVFCWGYNSVTPLGGYIGGRLGDGTTNDAYSPVIVKAGQQNPSDPTSYIKGIVAIGAGESHSMMLDANGLVYCVGSNNHGQLGSPEYTSGSTTALKVVGLNGVGYLTNIVKISAGYWHNLAIDSAGRTWAWGFGYPGELGLGASDQYFYENTPRPVPFYNDPNVWNKNKNLYYTSIQSALYFANSGDVIIVYPGIYGEPVTIGNPVTLQSSDPNNPVTVAQTMLIYPMSYPVTVNNSSTLLDGLTIQSSLGNGGVYCSASPTISHCVIRKTAANGIYCSSSSAPIIRNCIIANNAYGILCSSAGTVKIIDNVLVSNAYGIYITNGAEAAVRNCTIKNNSSGGIYRSGGTDPNISNCILWQNHNNGNGTYNNLEPSGGFGKVTYSCINSGHSGAGNISSDPCFVTALDFHIKAASLCINKGDPSTSLIAGETDIDNESRKNGTASIDIGADEVYGRGDLNGNEFVNLIDYAIFADAWNTHPSDTKWNAACDFIDDNNVNYKDLHAFTDRWLMRTDWLSLYTKSLNTGSSALYLAYDAQTPPDPNGEVTVYVHTTVPLVFMEMHASVVGDANITSGMSTADCNQYGWDPQYSSDPNIEPNGLIHITSATLGVDSNTVVGYFKLRPNSGQVNVAVTADSVAYDTIYEPVTFSTTPLTIDYVPNPPPFYLVSDGNTTPDPNTEVTVYVHTDVPLYSMAVYATVSGDANITTAMSTADCNQYGWEPAWSGDPYIDDVNGIVGISGGKWGTVDANTIVGYFKFMYHSGQVNVALTTDSIAYDANDQPVTYSTDPLIFGGESMQQQQMMQSSSSFQLESSSVVDVNSLVNWLENLWNNDAEVRAAITEARWQQFLDAVESNQ